MTQVLSHPLFAQLAPEWAGVSAWAAKLRASILEGGGPPPLLPRTFSHSNATSTLRAQFDPEAESGDDVLEAGPSVPTDPITLGTRPSFEQLVSEHEERIFNFILQFLRHRQDAEDLTQETFVKAYRSFDRYDPLLPFAPWLFTIARRTVASHFRSARQFEELTEERETGASDPA